MQKLKTIWERNFNMKIIEPEKDLIPDFKEKVKKYVEEELDNEILQRKQ